MREKFSGKQSMENKKCFDPDKLVNSLTENDETTGKTYLKIPVKDRKLLKCISRVIESFMGLFSQLTLKHDFRLTKTPPAPARASAIAIVLKVHIGLAEQPDV